MHIYIYNYVYVIYIYIYYGYYTYTYTHHISRWVLPQECQPFNPYPRVVPQHGKLSEENTLQKWLEGSPWATSCRLGTHRLNLFETNNLDSRSAYRSDATHKESAFGWTEVLRILCENQMLRGKQTDHSRGLVTINGPQSSQHIILTPLHEIIAIINKEGNYPSTSPKMAGTSADFGDRLPRYPQGVSSQIGSNNTAKHLVLHAPVGPPSSYELKLW